MNMKLFRYLAMLRFVGAKFPEDYYKLNLVQESRPVQFTQTPAEFEHQDKIHVQMANMSKWRYIKIALIQNI